MVPIYWSCMFMIVQVTQWMAAACSHCQRRTLLWSSCRPVSAQQLA